MTIIILTVAAAVTAVLAIQGEYKPNRSQVYLFKPLTTILIILIAFLGRDVTTPLYKGLVIAGLIFCLGGDVFLMLPARYFIAGLVSFLIGHLLYIAAFVSAAGFQFAPLWLLPLAVYGGLVYSLLHPHLGHMRLPVIIYMVAILTMAWQALARWSVQPTSSALLAAVGAVFFVLSDSALALDRFRARFKSARVIVLGTYWLAQWLIALSVGAYLALL
ncbi:MAG: lysoplasmalogenase [Ardenticatenaceae bacterium]|nr:lysoplasmalogenase [Ardenticatenaceae bacterium]MCB8986381.1 lysoplasmalogenase [Ardenticatenaceae bacterium]